VPLGRANDYILKLTYLEFLSFLFYSTLRMKHSESFLENVESFEVKKCRSLLVLYLLSEEILTGLNREHIVKIIKSILNEKIFT